VAFTRGIPGAATVFFTFDTVMKALKEAQSKNKQVRV